MQWDLESRVKGLSIFGEECFSVEFVTPITLILAALISESHTNVINKSVNVQSYVLRHLSAVYDIGLSSPRTNLRKNIIILSILCVRGPRNQLSFLTVGRGGTCTRSNQSLQNN